MSALLDWGTHNHCTPTGVLLCRQLVGMSKICNRLANLKDWADPSNQLKAFWTEQRHPGLEKFHPVPGSSRLSFLAFCSMFWSFCHHYISQLPTTDFPIETNGVTNTRYSNFLCVWFFFPLAEPKLQTGSLSYVKVHTPNRLVPNPSYLHACATQKYPSRPPCNRKSPPGSSRLLRGRTLSLFHFLSCCTVSQMLVWSWEWPQGKGEGQKKQEIDILLWSI